METIKHAAVKAKDGTVFTGKCHADCFHAGDSGGHKMSSKPDDQGFVTNLGKFVSREEAFQIAKTAKQIVDPREHSYLFSEDLWSKEERNDPYNYSPELGYHKQPRHSGG